MIDSTNRTHFRDIPRNGGLNHLSPRKIPDRNQSTAETNPVIEPSTNASTSVQPQEFTREIFLLQIQVYTKRKDLDGAVVYIEKNAPALGLTDEQIFKIINSIKTLILLDPADKLSKQTKFDEAIAFAESKREEIDKSGLNLEILNDFIRTIKLDQFLHQIKLLSFSKELDKAISFVESRGVELGLKQEYMDGIINELKIKNIYKQINILTSKNKFKEAAQYVLVNENKELLEKFGIDPQKIIEDLKKMQTLRKRMEAQRKRKIKTYVIPANFFDSETLKKSREYNVLQAIISSPGINPKLHSGHKANLSSIIKQVKFIPNLKQISKNHADVIFDGQILYVDLNLSRNATSRTIQKKTADALIDFLMLYTEKAIKDDSKLNEGVLGYIFGLTQTGFLDERMTYLYLINTPKLSKTLREKLFSALFTGTSLNDGAKSLKECMSIFRGTIKANLRTPNAQSVAELVVLTDILRLLKVDQITINALIHSEINKSNPDRIKKLADILNGKSMQEVEKYLFDYNGNAIASENISAKINRFFDDALICHIYFPLKDPTQLLINLSQKYSKDSTDYEHYLAKQMVNYFKISDPINAAFDKKLFFSFIEKEGARIRNEADFYDKYKLLAGHIQTLSQEGFFSEKEAHILMSKIMAPNLTNEEITIVNDYIYGKKSSRDKIISNYKIAVKEKNASKINDYVKLLFSNFVLSLSELIDIQKNTIGAITLPKGMDQEFIRLAEGHKKLMDNIDELKKQYDKTIKSSYIALKRGNKIGSDVLFQKAMDLTLEASSLIKKNKKEMEKLGTKTSVLLYGEDVSKRYTDAFTLESDSFFGQIQGYAQASIGITMKSLSFAYGNMRKKAKHARTLPISEQLRMYVINSGRASRYSDTSLTDSVSSIYSWNLHLRQAEISNLLSPSKIAAITRYARKYNVDPRLVAAIILSEQRDQSFAENITDAAGGILDNTSIGLGQVNIETAKKLFPELKKAPNYMVAHKLSDENFNIECIAKTLSSIISEGKKLFGRDLKIREIGSRYTSSSFTTMIPWGRFVEVCYNDILISDLFGKTRMEGFKKTFDLAEELRKTNLGIAF